MAVMQEVYSRQLSPIDSIVRVGLGRKAKFDPAMRAMPRRLHRPCPTASAAALLRFGVIGIGTLVPISNEKPVISIRQSLCTLAMVGLPAFAQLPPGDGPASVATTMLEASPVKFDDALLAKLRVPPGFRTGVFAKNMQHVRWIQVMPNGDTCVSRPKQADVLLLRDTKGDGSKDSQRIVAQNIKNVHGLAGRDKHAHAGDLP